MAPDGAAPRARDESEAAPEQQPNQPNQPNQPEQPVIRPLRLAVAADAGVVAEGDPATFTVMASGAPSSDPVVVEYAVSGTARAGVDYTLPASVATLDAGAMQAKITVATLADNESELRETIAVALERALAATGEVEVDTTPATVTVADPGTTIVSVAPAVAAEGEQAAFIVSVTGGARSGMTVRWETADGTAVAGADYTAVTGATVEFGSGSTRGTIRVATLQDQLDEEDETFEVSLTEVSPAAGAALGRATATGTIIDDDDPLEIIEGPPRLDIANSRAGEGDGIMVFAVTMNRPSATAATVFYETRDGTAKTFPGSDYTKTEGELTFSPGVELQQTIVVPILQDDEDEGTSESFTVKLLDPVDAVLGDDTATGVIVDDDTPADDHADTPAGATSITQGSPISGRLESADDVDYFKFTVTADGAVYAATDAGRIGDDGYPAGTVVRLESLTYTSSNDDNLDAVTVEHVPGSAQIHVRVSGASATRYDVAAWYVPPNEPDASFDIDLRYLGTEPTEAQKIAIRAAADVWENVISSGQPFRIIIHSGWKCDDEDPSTFGDYIDDIRIDIRLQRLDGIAGALAVAGPCVVRLGGLPLIGMVALDTADLGRFDSTLIRRLAVHEIAHVLGFGSIRQWRDLLGDSAVDYEAANPESTALPDTHFAGEAAVEAFDELLDGTTYDGKTVPVENDTGKYGPGGLDAHWREAVFGTELLTPTISSTSASHPLSKVTIAALEDLGYRVDYTQAESYTLPGSSLTTASLLRAARAAFDEFHVGDDIRRGPVIVAEYPE